MKVLMAGTGSVLIARQSPCYLIDETILVDIPNGAVKLLRNKKINLSSTDVLLITHFHADHYFDLPFLLLELGLVQKRDKPFYIYGPDQAFEKIKALFDLAYPGEFKKIMANAKVIIQDYTKIPYYSIDYSGYKIRFFDVDHGPIQAFGLTVTDGKKTCGFSGDSVLCANVEAIVSASDLAFVDCTFVKSKPEFGYHMGMNDLIVLKEKFPDCRIIPTHLSDQAYTEIAAHFHVPYDGEPFEILS